jgi:hypothetical protein
VLLRRHPRRSHSLPPPHRINTATFFARTHFITDMGRDVNRVWGRRLLIGFELIAASGARGVQASWSQTGPKGRLSRGVSRGRLGVCVTHPRVFVDMRGVLRLRKPLSWDFFSWPASSRLLLASGETSSSSRLRKK